MTDELSSTCSPKSNPSSEYKSFHSSFSRVLCIQPKVNVWNSNNGGGSAVKLLDFFKKKNLTYCLTTQRRPVYTPLLLKAKTTDSFLKYQKLLARTQMRVLRNGLPVNWEFFLCVSVSSYWLNPDWRELVHILRVRHLGCGHTVKFNQKNYICKEKKKTFCNISWLGLLLYVCVSESVCVCVWPYFPLSAVCSYSNQYVSCLHWSGLDNHHSYMVSPQQMPETDRGAERKKPNEKVESCTGWENVSVRHAAPQMLLRFMYILSERSDSRIVSGIGTSIKISGRNLLVTYPFCVFELWI